MHFLRVLGRNISFAIPLQLHIFDLDFELNNEIIKDNFKSVEKYLCLREELNTLVTNLTEDQA